MKKAGSCGIVFIGLLLAVSLAAVADSLSPDLILVNGKLFTGVRPKSYAQAISIRGDRVVAVGDSTVIEASAGPSTRRIDLGGRTVIPGINDAHQHIGVRPANTIEVVTKGPPDSWPTMRQALAAAVTQAPTGSWLQGVIGPAIFHDPTVRRSALDAIAPNNPVMLITFSGHGAILNSAALLRLGLREDQENPVGGSYGRSPDGRRGARLRNFAA